MKNLLKKLWRDESAQGMAEYVLLLVVVVTILVAFKGQITEIVSGKVDSLGGQIQSF